MVRGAVRSPLARGVRCCCRSSLLIVFPVLYVAVVVATYAWFMVVGFLGLWFASVVLNDNLFEQMGLKKISTNNKKCRSKGLL